MRMSCRRSADVGNGCPSITERMITPSVAETWTIFPSPNNHACAVPDCRVTIASRRRASGTHSRPMIGHWVVSSTAIKSGRPLATPNDHLPTSPHGSMKVSRRRCTNVRHGTPRVTRRIITSASTKITPVKPAPNDHLAAGPNRRVIEPSRREGIAQPDISSSLAGPACTLRNGWQHQLCAQFRRWARCICRPAQAPPGLEVLLLPYSGANVDPLIGSSHNRFFDKSGRSLAQAGLSDFGRDPFARQLRR